MLSLPVFTTKANELILIQQDWCSGSIVLNNGTSIEGELKYDLEAEAVHLKLDGTIRTFVANQIVGFNFLQPEVDRKRYFITLPFEAKGGYKRPKLFEVAYTNEVSLLVREENPYSTWTTMDPSQDLDPVRRYVRRRTLLEFDYYLSDKEGNVTMIKNKGAKAVTRSFDNHHKRLKDYIKSEKLKVKQLNDLVKLVHYYNVIEAETDSNLD